MANATAVTQATISGWLKDRPDSGQRHIHRVAGGLDLRVYSTGPGAWFWRGKPRGLRPNGTRWPLQRVRIGTTAEMTLAGAIAAAAALKAEIARGGDPAGDRRRAVAGRIAARTAEAARATCRELIRLYGAAMAARGASQAHTQAQVGQVTRGLDAVGLLDGPPEMVTVEAIETMMARCPLKSRASRFGSLDRFLKWTSRRDGGSTTPPTAMFAPHERPKRGVPRQRVLTLGELKAVWLAAGELGGVDASLTRFLLAVPCRRGEAALMTWRDVDLSGGMWTMPVSKNGLAHRFHLPRLALDVLQTRKRDVGLVPDADGLVFPGITTGGVFTTWSHLKRRLDARLLLRGQEPRRLDDRMTCGEASSRSARSSSAPMTTCSIWWSTTVPARTRNKVSRTYNLSERREDRIRLARNWNQLLVSLIEGRPSDQAGTSEAEIVTLTPTWREALWGECWAAASQTRRSFKPPRPARSQAAILRAERRRAAIIRRFLADSDYRLACRTVRLSRYRLRITPPDGGQPVIFDRRGPEARACPPRWAAASGAWRHRRYGTTHDCRLGRISEDLDGSRRDAAARRRVGGR